MPMTMILKKLVVNNNIAPDASYHDLILNINPTTQRGGTNEIDIATPGKAPAISLRTVKEVGECWLFGS
jgi:hypothetical protein